MIVSITDVLIVLFIIAGGVVGYRNGFIREGIQLIGIVLITIIAFLLKDSLMILLYENLPFFDFFGMIKGITAVNILFYQIVAFVLIFAALFFLLRVLIVLTGLIELLVRITVFLKTTSNILGIVVGLLEFYVYVFLILYILNMPVFNLSYINESQVSNMILQNTPVLASYVDDTVYAYADIWNIIENKNNSSNKEVNTLVLATLLDNDLLTVDSARKLVESNKILITDPSILDNYSDDGNFYDYVIDKIPIDDLKNKKKTKK